MKKAIAVFNLSFFIFCLTCFFAGAKVFSQNVSPLPKPIPVGSPIVHILEKKNVSNEKNQSVTGNRAFTTYTADDGLGLDAVYCSATDHFGNLWFGTQGGGVCKYDGKSFVIYTTAQGLTGNNIWDMLEDRSGNMWFCTSGGVSKYDGKSFTTYAFQKYENSNVWSIAEDHDGNIWLGTSGEGVSKYDGKSFVNYTTAQGLVNNTVKCMFADKKGNIWMGTNEGVSKYDGKSFVNYTSANGLAHNYILCMEEDKTGNIWFGTKDKGLSKYDGKSFVSYTATQGLPNNDVKCIYKDKTGNLWFGTEGGGISKYDGKSFVNYTKTQGLANNYVASVLEDKTGNLWFCTNGGGVSKYEGESFVNYNSVQGLENVWSIEEDRKGNLWLATNAGLSSFDGNSFTKYIDAKSNSILFCVTEDNAGNIWYGTYEEGIYRYDGKSCLNYTISQGLSSNSVRYALKSRNGELWFATDEGVCRYNGKTFTIYTMAHGLVNNLVYSVLEDKAGNFWFATNGGISRFDGRSFTNYTTAQGLLNNAVYAILEDKEGRLWFGTQQGLSYFITDPKMNGPNMFSTITTENGLPDNYITQVVELPNGKMAVGTNIGIAIFNRPQLKQKKLTDLELFNSSTGYPVRDVNSGENTMFIDHKGIMWIATGSDKTGLVRFDYSDVYRNLSPPKVLIQNIKIEEQNICWQFIRKKKLQKNAAYSDTLNSVYSKEDSLSLLLSEFYAFGKSVSQKVLYNQFAEFGDIRFDDITKFYHFPKDIVLPYNHNQISFEYAAIEPARPYMIKYQYILEGYDKGWSPVTNRTSVSFGNIYEGTYTFRLKACSPFGVWSEPITYTFRVLPPWWRTWWMYTLYVIIGICIILIVSWINNRRLRLKANELAHEIQKATITILEQKKIVEQQKHSVEEKNMHITDSINYAQRIQNAILPEREYISSLFENYFIYFQPKEIVSGDFYWFGEKDDKIIFAAVDCTGHGVPGALMSMIGNTLLNETINGKGIVESHEILNDLRTAVIYALKQRDAAESQKDGMDIALCVYDKTNNLIEFSGAHNSMYHFHNGVLKEIKGDPQAIGYEKKEQQAFIKNKIEVKKGDMLYLFTDGFVDQKGGAHKKKFYYQPFRDLLASIQHQEMSKQEEILRTTFNEWKGNLEQIDDVLIIGIKL